MRKPRTKAEADKRQVSGLFRQAGLVYRGSMSAVVAIDLRIDPVRDSAASPSIDFSLDDGLTTAAAPKLSPDLLLRGVARRPERLFPLMVVVSVAAHLLAAAIVTRHDEVAEAQAALPAITVEIVTEDVSSVVDLAIPPPDPAADLNLSEFEPDPPAPTVEAQTQIETATEATHSEALEPPIAEEQVAAAEPVAEPPPVEPPPPPQVETEPLATPEPIAPPPTVEVVILPIDPLPAPPPPVQPAPAVERTVKPVAKIANAPKPARVEPKPPRQAEQHRPSRSPEHAAAPAVPKPARAATAGASASEISAYRGSIVGRLASSKRYPESARARGAQGTAVVTFRIDGSGHVVGLGLARSSGQADIDAETLAMVRRAAPFPPPPGGVAQSFTAPVNYHLR